MKKDDQPISEKEAARRAKISAANKGKVFTEERKKNISLAKTGFKATAETRAILRAAARSRLPMSDVSKEKMRAALMGHLTPDSVRAKISQKLTGFKHTAPKRMKGPENSSAKKVTLRSPDNVVYRVLNITHFVRTHENLFPEKSVVWNVSHTRCLAASGLHSLIRFKNPAASWRGWTVVSAAECNHHDGVDLLNRQPHQDRE